MMRQNIISGLMLLMPMGQPIALPGKHLQH